VTSLRATLLLDAIDDRLHGRGHAVGVRYAWIKAQGDAHELHISAEISSEISWTSPAAVAAGASDALVGLSGEPHATTAASKRKGAKRTS